VADPWFSLCTPVSSINKTDRHDIAEILLQEALNTINQPLLWMCRSWCLNGLDLYHSFDLHFSMLFLHEPISINNDESQPYFGINKSFEQD
jgi:hypothetical protein